MRYRCPICGYDSGLLYPMHEEDWYIPCLKCGNTDLEYYHFGYPVGIKRDYWTNKKGETVEEERFWYEVQ